jgi:succinate dehydrogenase/fumarate reductase flavoprotein subunit
MNKSDQPTRPARRTFLKAGAGAAALSGLAVTETLAAKATGNRWTHETDVIVVGYGGAGACAAIEAADTGAKVIIIEKQAQATHYPDCRMAGGNFHSPDPKGNRAALKAMGLAQMSGDNLSWKLEGEQSEIADELAALWAEHSPDNLPFLMRLDPDFKPARGGGPAFPDFPGSKESGYRVYTASYSGKADSEIPTKDLPKKDKMNGEALFACMSTGVNARKTIQVMYETPAQSLVKDDKGDIIGVVAVSKGKEIRVKAKRGVVLTTGGYEFSATMRKAFLEGPGVEGWAFYGSPDNTGDGIEMAQAVGGGLMGAGKVNGRLIAAVPVRSHGLKHGIVTDTIGMPNTIVVDNTGARFVDETMIAGGNSRYFSYKSATAFDLKKMDFVRLPGWMVFDETFRSTKTLTSMGFGAAGFGIIPWTKDNMDAVNRGWILKGDTIEELAAKIKAHKENRDLMNPATLTASVTGFNTGCAEGKDVEFGRKVKAADALSKGPFYAIPLYAGGPSTGGGIAANAQRQVVDWKRRPIGRLFTAGEMCQPFRFIYTTGCGLGPAITFGRIAGRNAAKLKPWG